MTEKDFDRHPNCKECGQSLIGCRIVTKTDGPYNGMEHIPSDEDHEHYEMEVAHVLCRGCNRKIPITPQNYWEMPEKL